jgi:hypothetical protein
MGADSETSSSAIRHGGHNISTPPANGRNARHVPPTSPADPVRRRSILIGSHARVLSAHRLSALLTSAHLHGVAFDFWLGSRRHIRDRHLVGSFPLQFAPTTRALGDRHCHRLRRPTGRCGRQGVAESKSALPGLAARPFSLPLHLDLPPALPRPDAFSSLRSCSFSWRSRSISLRLVQLIAQVTNLRLPFFQLLS